MAEKNNAVCSICGNSYYACMSCKDTMKLHPYKIYCCSPSHFQVFQVVRGFSTGVYEKDEFKSKLLNIDLSDLEDYREHIKTLIKDVLKEEKKEVVIEVVDKVFETTEKIEDTVVEDVVESTKIKVEETETTENIKDTVVPIVSRRRNYKANNLVEEFE